MRAVVVGGGVMGLATAWGLGRRGHHVTVVEQGPLPNPLGSSVDQHRLIRFPYGARPGYTRMVADAYEEWEKLFADVGERPYQETGSLVLAAGSDEWARASADCLRALGHRPEWLSPGELGRRFPLVDAGRLRGGFHLASGGVLLASRIVAALARQLAADGAVILTETRVAQVDLGAARVTLADGRELAGDAVVVAAGAWAPRLLPELRSLVTPSRQVVAYLQPPPELAPLWASAPLLLDIDEQGFYLVPPVLGTGLKVGDHRFSLRGDPDREREAHRDEAEAVAELCRGRLADFERYRVLGGKTCFYTVEPGERFLVRARGRGIVVSACSGHAFKFGSVIGTRVAETLGGERDAAWLERWAAGETA